MPFDVIGFVAALLLGLTAIFAVALFLLRGMARRREASARERYPNARFIDRTASFFGQQSRGVTQPRGNGLLILTSDELIFEMWVPNREFRVPLARIQGLENPTSFLGKSRFAPLLKVVYLNEHGEADAMAWQVRDLPGWMQALQEPRG